MKRIILLIMVVFVVFLLYKKSNVKEVSINKRFKDEYYSFSDLTIGDRKNINYTVTNNSVVPVKVRVRINDKWMNPTGKIINAPSDAVIISINNNDWEFHNKYYYYKYTLNVGETSSPLVYFIELNNNLSDVKCTNSEGISICTGDMGGLANMNYKLSFQNDFIDSNIAGKVWNYGVK